MADYLIHIYNILAVISVDIQLAAFGYDKIYKLFLIIFGLEFQLPSYFPVGFVECVKVGIFEREAITCNDIIAH